VEQQLLAAMRTHRGASASILATTLGVGRGAIVARWQRLARCGLIEKRADGRWQAAPEPQPIEPEPVIAHAPWIRSISSYNRRESSELQGSRYG
jgi:hypothetical protein